MRHRILGKIVKKYVKGVNTLGASWPTTPRLRSISSFYSHEKYFLEALKLVAK